MVRSGKSNQEVEKFLKDTNSAVKNEILFSEYQINYNNIEEIYRRGTLLYYLSEKEEVEENN
jgi:tRNA(His) guanylyltransferase